MLKVMVELALVRWHDAGMGWKSCASGWWRVVLVLLVVAGTGRWTTAQAAPPATGPGFSLRNCPVLPPSKMSLADVARQWDLFGARDEGVSVVLLPFRTRPESQERLGPLANAFAFLISFDLDYADNCYCARHAYFVYKRSGRIVRMREGYSQAEVGRLVTEWNGTHAVGASIDGPDSEHLVGTLEVYDAAGNEVMRKGYKEPRPWNQLLGDMSVDAMRATGYQPSDALVRYLHEPRTKSLKALKMLGQAAFLPERGEEEFGLYERILGLDPGFAEVRYWYGNQAFWVNPQANGLNYHAMKMMTIQARPVAVAFDDINMHLISGSAARDYINCRKRLEELLGPRSPRVVLSRLQITDDGKKLVGAGAPRWYHGMHDVLEQAVAACARNPADQRLVLRTVEALPVHRDDPLDMDRCISLMLRCVTSRAMPGMETGERTGSAALMLANLGYPEHALVVIRQGDSALEHSTGQTAAVEANLETAWFSKLAKAKQEFDLPLGHPEQAFAGAVCGDRRWCDALMLGWGDRRPVNGVVMNGILALAEGQEFDLTVLPALTAHEWEVARRFRVLTEFALALRQDERSPGEAGLLRHASVMANSRLVMFCLANYLTRWKVPQYQGMAEVWEWWHPEDPLVAELQRLKPTSAPRMDMAAAERVLAEFPSVPALPEPAMTDDQADKLLGAVPPLPFAYELKRLCEQDRKEHAIGLAQRYRNAAHRYGYDLEWRLFANHLLHRVQRWKGTVEPVHVTMR